jgi:hypothetical protein
MSTYTPIASVTLSSAQSSVTFSGIPQTYTDLVLVANTATNTSTNYYLIEFNSDTGSNYSSTHLRGTGSAASSTRYSNQTSIFTSIGSTINTTKLSSIMIAQIMNYSNSTTYKTVLARDNNAGTEVDATVALWRSTSAITSIKISIGANNFDTGSTFALYGVANAGITNADAKATGGESVYTDGTYWYHIFRSSGTFTPTQALTAHYLVVAGGGGGGANSGGGGGAGGLRSTVTATGGGGSLESALSLIAQAYTVTVGAGGPQNGYGGSGGGAGGSNSTFATITATGGGRGGTGWGGTYINGGNGGSGGGQCYGGYGAAGTGTANQGYNGGTSGAANNGNNGGGGGGGAGASGSNTSGTSGGNGGAGVAVSITGSSVTYAGGGGGGAGNGSGSSGGSGGSGGGGAGSNYNGPAGTAGTANTGGGGGAGAYLSGSNGGAGGSGIVIIRYSAA